MLYSIEVCVYGAHIARHSLKVIVHGRSNQVSYAIISKCTVIIGEKSKQIGVGEPVPEMIINKIKNI